MSEIRKRTSRYAHVAASATRIAVGGKKDRAILVRAALGNLKGPLMKIGQLLAAIPDFLPPEYAAELATLQSNAPSMGWPFVRRRMIAELGYDWQNRFQTFEEKARFAASLGQVHYAKTHDGQEIACKLQYPDMESVIDADLRQLKIAFNLFECFSGAISTRNVFDEIAQRVREELDYAREARNITLYGQMLADVNSAHVPCVIKELSTPRLLCMSWQSGKTLADVEKNYSQKDRNLIARNLFVSWYAPFYKYGVIHGDPHPGNYTFCEDGSVNLLDFGCIRVFEPELVQAVIMMFTALRDNDEAKAVEAYRLWGFEKPTKALVNALTIWARFIYAPILQNRVCSIEETNATTQGRKAAAQVYQELRKIGNVPIPRPFVMIDRASVGLGAVFLRLGAKLNWAQIFGDLTQDFDLAQLKNRQNKIVAPE